MRRGGVSGARGLAVQAARRHSRLHRWEMQRLPYAPRRQRFCSRFRSVQQGLCRMAVHARAAREDCEARRSHFKLCES